MKHIIEKFKIFFGHAYYSVKNGQWSIGFESRKTWPGKPYFSFFCTYYDGNHWCLHLGWFYVGASYY